jgi:hypothetical protein
LEDIEVAQLRQRRLSQPFAWHQDPAKNENLLQPNSQEKANSLEQTTHEKAGDGVNSTEDKIVTPSTCRNSVQGQIFIADDRGKNQKL